MTAMYAQGPREAKGEGGACASVNAFPWTPEEERIREACKRSHAPGKCEVCPVLICGMARVPVRSNRSEPVDALLEYELADYVAFLLMTAEGLPTGLDIEGFSDRRLWPKHPIMQTVADIIDLS